MNDSEISEKMELFTEEEIKKTAQQSKQYLADPPTTREKLYEYLRKWLFLPDTNRVDLILATYVSTKDDGKPLWIFIVGGSGDAKSELLNTLVGLPNVRKIDQLTANTLASGKENVKDLGEELQGKKTLLIFTDLACLTSLNKDEKKKIWSQFRTLYDGEIYKDTGSGAHKKYDNCHVNILAATTSHIKDEYHVHQQLGTRELLYDTEADPRDNDTKMKAAMQHCGKESTMKFELRSAVQDFIRDKEYNPDIKIPSDIIRYIFDSCEKLRILRATGKTDWKTGEVDVDFEAEVTTRLVQQLTKLYRALHSIDTEYPDNNYKDIVERIIKSSSDPVRYKLYHYFPKTNDDWYTSYDLHLKFKNSRISISSQCEALWNLGLLEKKIEIESIGGYITEDRETGHPVKKGGRVDRVSYYRWNGLKLEDLT